MLNAIKTDKLFVLPSLLTEPEGEVGSVGGELQRVAAFAFLCTCNFNDADYAAYA